MITAPACARVLELVDHYLRKERPDAAERLYEAVETALRHLDEGTSDNRSFPGPYRTLILPDVRWIKVHRYWFGWRWSGDHNSPVVTQILYDQADMPRRLLADGPAIPWSA